MKFLLKGLILSDKFSVGNVKALSCCIVSRLFHMSVNYKRIVKCLAFNVPLADISLHAQLSICMSVYYICIYIKIIFVYRYLSICSYKDIQMYNLNMFAEMDCFRHIYLLLWVSPSNYQATVKYKEYRINVCTYFFFILFDCSCLSCNHHFLV